MKDRGTGGRDWFKDIVSHCDKGIIEQLVELNGVKITVYCDDSCVEHWDLSNEYKLARVAQVQGSIFKG